MTILNHLGNPAHGLTAAPPGAWENRATCASQDPDLWHTSSHAINWTQVGEARHICLRHCPVRQECAERIGPMRSAIVGGVFYGQDGRQAKFQPLANRCRICAPKKREAPSQESGRRGGSSGIAATEPASSRVAA